MLQLNVNYYMLFDFHNSNNIFVKCFCFYLNGVIKKNDVNKFKLSNLITKFLNIKTCDKVIKFPFHQIYKSNIHG